LLDQKEIALSFSQIGNTGKRRWLLLLLGRRADVVAPEPDVPAAPTFCIATQSPVHGQEINILTLQNWNNQVLILIN
jgi:hypothetical protein